MSTSDLVKKKKKNQVYQKAWGLDFHVPFCNHMYPKSIVMYSVSHNLGYISSPPLHSTLFTLKLECPCNIIILKTEKGVSKIISCMTCMSSIALLKFQTI